MRKLSSHAMAGSWDLSTFRLPCLSRCCDDTSGRSGRDMTYIPLHVSIYAGANTRTPSCYRTTSWVDVFKMAHPNARCKAIHNNR